MNKLYKVVIFNILIIFSVIFSAQAQITYPESTGAYINDFADLLHPQDKANLLKLLNNVEKQTGIEIVIVTINSRRDYGDIKQKIEPFATGLYNEWGIGHKDVNKGALILVAKQDRQVRIELGAAYGSQYDGVMQEIIDELMLPFFKTGDYSRGIYQGSNAIVENLTTGVSWSYYYRYELILAAIALVCIAAGISCMIKGKKGWGWAFFAIAAAIIAYIFNRVGNSDKSNGRRNSSGRSGGGGGRSGGGGASGSW